MIKRKIVETTEKFDEEGRLIEKVTREEHIDDDAPDKSKWIYRPEWTPWWQHEPMC